MGEPLANAQVQRNTTLVTTERLIEMPIVPPNTFVSNKINTSKYNWLTFLPKNLWYQFHKLANVYFLIVCILQVIPEVSVTDGVPSLLFPLIIVLAISGVKDLLEDYKRKKSDEEENTRKCLRWLNGTWSECEWKEIEIGDILKVRKDEFFPADILLLTSSESKGICYIETKNLDGETNLKHKIASKETVSYFTDDSTIDNLRASIRCEGPNPMIYQFSGLLKIGNNLVVPISSDQFLLRGSSLKNTEWVVGIVTYTGHESKIMLNSSEAKGKFSQLEMQMNKQILYIFIMQVLLSFFGALYYGIWFGKNIDETKQYLELSKQGSDNAAAQFFLIFFSWMLIFTNFVPISLIVTLEMVKFLQAIFISWDIKIYYEVTDTPTEVHSSNLNEELGQISYVFSDKTGTLTCNVMEFRKFTVMGKAFGTDVHQDLSEKIDNVDFVDPNFNINEPSAEEFFLYLAICHTVLAEENEGQTIYKASSPDELALLNAAKFFGIVFVERDENQNLVIDFRGRKITVELLNVIEFSSDRKRMTVVVRMPEGNLKLICKGADSVLLPRLVKTNIIDRTFSHLEEFGNEGLRTLVIAYRDLNKDFYEKWNKKFIEAMNDIHHRDTKIEELGEEIETELSIIGATAIEDKLQNQVPETIERLRNAGVKVWVLTGDKVETAINIGFSCNLLTSSMVRIQVVGSRTAAVKEELEQAIYSIKAEPEAEFALIVAGDALIRALKPEMKSELLKITDFCKVVLACRVSPQQKADIVTMIRDAKPKVRTLGIGDGANDVNMIQAAHVGIGISGLEGRQAVRASDYAIAQFSYLQRLMFVHGRESYRKNATLVCYNFYKNVLLVMPLFFYGIFSAFSGQMLYNTWTYQIFNLMFAALPIILYAIFDRETSYDKLIEPLYYKLGLKGKLFNSWEFWGWILEAILQGFFLCLVSTFIVCGATSKDQHGHIGSMWVVSCMVFWEVVLLSNVKVAIFSKLHFWFTVVVLVLSVLSYLLVSALLSEAFPISTFLDNFGYYGATNEMLGNGNFYLATILIAFSAFFFQPILFTTLDLLKVMKSRKNISSAKIESLIAKKQDKKILEGELSEEQYRAAVDAIKRFSVHHTGFAYSEAPGQTPQITDPSFANQE